MDINQLLPLLAPLAFPVMWCAMCFLLASLSGWRALATKFRAHHTPAGQRFRMQRAILRSTRFSGVLTFIVGPEGLYLKMWPLFSVFGLAAPALLIPWSELGALRKGRWSWFETWTTGVALSRFNRVAIIFLDRHVAGAVEAFVAPANT